MRQKKQELYKKLREVFELEKPFTEARFRELLKEAEDLQNQYDC